MERDDYIVSRSGSMSREMMAQLRTQYSSIDDADYHDYIAGEGVFLVLADEQRLPGEFQNHDHEVYSDTSLFVE